MSFLMSCRFWWNNQVPWPPQENFWSWSNQRCQNQTIQIDWPSSSQLVQCLIQGQQRASNTLWRSWNRTLRFSNRRWVLFWKIYWGDLANQLVLFLQVEELCWDIISSFFKSVLIDINFVAAAWLGLRKICTIFFSFCSFNLREILFSISLLYVAMFFQASMKDVTKSRIFISKKKRVL